MSQPPPELFPQRPIRSDFGRRGPSYRTRRVITVLILLLVLIGLGRWIFGSPFSSHPGEIPTIKAETTPYKQKPEQPGGIDIPHQDVEVYQALDNKEASKPEIEHLLPPPEVPQIAPPQATAVNNRPVNPPWPAASSLEAKSPQVENSSPSQAENIPPVSSAPPVTTSQSQITTIPTTVESQPEKSSPSVATAPAAVQSEKPATAPIATAPPQKKKAPANSEKTHRVIQLASVQDETTAQDLMNKLQTRYASVLGDAQLSLVQADLGSKGTYYRIRSQPVPDADKICAAIKKLKGACILVR